MTLGSGTGIFIGTKQVQIVIFFPKYLGRTARSTPHQEQLKIMATTLSTLRRTIAQMENRPVEFGNLDRQTNPSAGSDPGSETQAGSPSLPASQHFQNKNKSSTKSISPLATGLDAIDGLFSDHGLASNALHEVHAPEARSAGAATGFLAGLLVRLAQTGSDRMQAGSSGQAHSTRARSFASEVFGAGSGKPVLWVQNPTSAGEAGRLHAPGLFAFGLDPQQVITLTARSMQETLWALEEGLSCKGLGAVVGDIRGYSKALDLTATRRLALRAAEARVPVFFLKTSAPEEASAARSRWKVTPAPSRPLADYQYGLGNAAWRLELTKNRDGPIGTWTLEWNPHDQFFSLVTLPGTIPSGTPEIPRTLVAASGDGSSGPHAMGTVMAFKRAG